MPQPKPISSPSIPSHSALTADLHADRAEKPRFDIVIPDHYCCDFIFPNMTTFPTLGTELLCDTLTVAPGGALNSIIALRRLGVNVGWVGELGNDFFSHYIQHQLEDEGIDLSLVDIRRESFKRVTVALSFPADRAFVTHNDHSPLNSISFALSALDRADFPHLHLTSLVLDDRIPALITECHARGIFVSMDCQYNETTINDPLVREILSMVDLFMPNCCEASALTGTDGPEPAMEILAEFVKFIVIKCGKNGAIAARGAERYKAGPLSGIVPLDTTGAGDVFNAGFLCAFRAGQDVKQCMQWGNFCGGMSTQGVGGATAAPTKEQLQEWLMTQG